jgi:hypothetical protein
MTLKVVGAGVGRTGTLPLKLALEQLLGGPCHHMAEVISNPGQMPVCQGAPVAEMSEISAIARGLG